MARLIAVLAALMLSVFVIAGSGFAEDAHPAGRIDCFEACDTEMMGCLKKCPQNEDGDFDKGCRNICAIEAFHPCLDKCPHPRTGLSPAQKREMRKIKKQEKKDSAQ
ncbi:MAG: hypothetical protein QF890_16785 [Myxococcota bacterium]|jgi:hypothetical protein|nr:hypothetical protein [bacterium]MDP6073541.1 hypothetical protein [Myxococcota bacterium]MDP7073179.1 hypothetical protein [Myxococcota bacterium]MDP7301383.1 hypothetical protein [Myxococcota bacterium]MDP7434215.1 hypothetical protein [Myxococcota bacterium]